MSYTEQARAMRPLIVEAAQSYDDEIALTVPYMYESWKTDTTYSIGDRVRYEETLYKCIQAHTSQTSWTPNITPALWTRVTVEEWPEWVQPTGSTDAYMINDKVSHNEMHYISIVDYNIWEPGVYGWDKVE